MDGLKWECFCDDSYYHMWAVRPVGDKSFSSQKLFHVPSEAEAKALAKILTTPPPGYALVKLEGAEEKIEKALACYDGALGQTKSILKALTEGE